MSYNPVINNISLFKNRIINGDFALWQRGTSASYASDSVNLTSDGGYKTSDRIIGGNIKAGGQFTISKGVLNNYNSVKVMVDTPPDNLTWDGTNLRYWAPFYYKFEGQHLYDIASRKSGITISFLFNSNVSGTYSISLINYSYTGQTGLTDQTQYDTYVTSFSYPGDQIARKITVSIPLDYNWVYGVFNDEKLGFILFISLLGDGLTTTVVDQWQSGTSGNAVGAPFTPLTVSGYTNWAATAGNYIEIAQLQVEESSSPTNFEHVPFDIQLLRCLRYYEKSYPLDVLPGTATFSGCESINLSTAGTGVIAFNTKFIVPKRSTPAITVYSPSTGSSGVVYSAGADRAATIDFVSNTSFRAYWNDSATTKDNTIFHYVADSEL